MADKRARSKRVLRILDVEDIIAGVLSDDSTVGRLLSKPRDKATLIRVNLESAGYRIVRIPAKKGAR